MKKTTATLLACLAGLGCALPAYADSSIIPPSKPWVEHTSLVNALKNIPDTSDFYQALAATGLLDELQSGGAYTVFAPVNGAFERALGDKNACFASASCKANLANILRNHIVYGGVNISDAAKNTGGLYSLNQHFIRIGQPDANYVADGYIVRGGRNFTGGSLYLIEGVIASNQELTLLQHPDYALPVAPPPPKENVNVTKIIDQNCDAEPGCKSETTVIDRTIVGTGAVQP